MLKIIKRNKDISKKGKIVRLKSMLCGLSLISVLVTGCSKKENSNFNDYLTKNGILTSNQYDIENLYVVDSVSIDSIEENMFKELFTIEESYSKVCNVDEFSNLININNITWNDIRDVINNNSNLDNEIRNLLLSSIDNLESNNINLNLSILYYNLKDLKIEYTDSILDDTSINATGYFNAFNKTCYLSNDIPSEYKDSTIIHEIIGHGSNIAYDNNTKTYCTMSRMSFELGEDKKSISVDYIGQSYSEAIANMITSLAYKKDATLPYATITYYYSILLKMNNIDLGTAINKGYDYLLTSMKNNNINNTLDFILIGDKTLDNITNSNIEIEDYELQMFLTAYMQLFIDNMINNGCSREEIFEYIDKLCNTPKKYINYKKVDNDRYIDSNNNYGYSSTMYIDQLINYLKEYTESMYDSKKIKS